MLRKKGVGSTQSSQKKMWSAAQKKLNFQTFPIEMSQVTIKKSAKDLYYRRRMFSFKNNDAVEVTKLRKSMARLNLAASLASESEQSDVDSLRTQCSLRIQEALVVDEAFFIPLTPIVNRHRTIDSFEDTQVRDFFRFQKKEDLHRLRLGFQFPDRMPDQQGKLFTGDEVLLAGLYRLAHCNSLHDASWVSVFGWSEPRASSAIALFFDHLLPRWQYLVKDHFDFWADRIPACAKAIDDKVAALGGVVAQDTLASFIDCTQIATARPGGGPRSDGHRNNPLIQRAFYNGWKHNHGIKFQTIDLPNGMNFHVSDASSLRHNDLFMWHESDMEAKLQDFFENELDGRHYATYGDSAYAVLNDAHVTYRAEVEVVNEGNFNKHLSSCRESIEWNYGSLKTLFKGIDYSKKLRIRHIQVESMVMAAFLMRNAHVTMYGCQTSAYFEVVPPTFEEWIAAGPRNVIVA